MTAPRDGFRELEDLEVVFKALAHAARRHVLLTLHHRGGQMTSRDIAARFSHTWPTTSGHLRVLEQAGLVNVTGRGRERLYRLDPERLSGVVGGWLRHFREEPLVRPDEPDQCTT